MFGGTIITVDMQLSVSLNLYFLRHSETKKLMERATLLIAMALLNKRPV